MEDKNEIIVAGQWYGYFSYGPEYGPKLHGEKVIFSLLIEDVFNNQFKGKCIELEGFGASSEISKIEGFIRNGFISFKKEYSTHYSIDECGNDVAYEGLVKPKLSYQGEFAKEAGTYSGTWEILSNERQINGHSFINVSTGKWEISRAPTKYGI